MDVNQIFKDLGMLVHEQGEVLGEFMFVNVDIDVPGVPTAKDGREHRKSNWMSFEHFK